MFSSIIDLSKPMYTGMDVYHDDPKVNITRLFSYDEKGYIISKISMGNHTGTHIDAPMHMIKDGKSLDKFKMSYFFGQAVLIKYKFPNKINLIKNDKCVILDNVKLNSDDIRLLHEAEIHLLGFNTGCLLTIPLIKKLLEYDILPVGELIHLNLLPKRFYFSAFPLRLKNCDGSPVRAVAYINL